MAYLAEFDRALFGSVINHELLLLIGIRAPLQTRSSFHAFVLRSSWLYAEPFVVYFVCARCISLMFNGDSAGSIAARCIFNRFWTFRDRRAFCGTSFPAVNKVIFSGS